jgi:hypothetical protein
MNQNGEYSECSIGYPSDILFDMFLGKVVDVPYSDFILFIAFANIEIEILE